MIAYKEKKRTKDNLMCYGAKNKKKFSSKNNTTWQIM
jgi:hypothetical protein